MKIAILGAGAMGAALTIPFNERGQTVALWCTEHDGDIRRALEAGHAHPKLDVILPESVRLHPPDRIEEALAEADLVVLGVSTAGVLPVLRQAAPHLPASTPILTVAKGFVSNNGIADPVPSGVQRELQKLLDESRPSVFSLAGPSIAGELARRQTTAAAVAGEDPGSVEELCEALATPYFWLDPVHDQLGLEICLSFKNVYAIPLSWPQGLRGSDNVAASRNLSAILLLQAVDELRGLITARQGNPDTANGWAGLGDLAATAGGGRNGRFGQLLAEGKSPDEAADALASEGAGTIEGRDAAACAVDYAVQTFGSDWANRLPLLHATCQVLEGRQSVREVLGRIDRFREEKHACRIGADPGETR
ncbi:MAG: NAD(P)H-dependent glycerol-3-phosphate dehydrogenase [Puniceicoccaceae bacterium]